MLFWENREFAKPGCFLVPDALHDWHKFTMGHTVKWVRMLLGDQEVDKRSSSLQRHVGFCHFKNGFTRFRQHTGREIRDIARSLIVACYGHSWLRPSITRAFRGLIDFILCRQDSRISHFCAPAVSREQRCSESSWRPQWDTDEGPFRYSETRAYAKLCMDGEIAQLTAAVFSRSDRAFTHFEREASLSAHESQRLRPTNVPISGSIRESTSIHRISGVD